MTAQTGGSAACATLRLGLPHEEALAAFGGALATGLSGGEFIALRGPLGAGKTTLARALLRACGHAGTVRSPTFTLVEPYELERFSVLHLDLYRLVDAEELEWLGVRERFGEAVLMIEWPERGAGWLPPADLDLHLDFAQPGRILTARALSELGGRLLCPLTNDACVRPECE